MSLGSKKNSNYAAKAKGKFLSRDENQSFSFRFSSLSHRKARETQHRKGHTSICSNFSTTTGPILTSPWKCTFCTTQSGLMTFTTHQLALGSRLQPHHHQQRAISHFTAPRAKPEPSCSTYRFNGFSGT